MFKMNLLAFIDELISMGIHIEAHGSELKVFSHNESIDSGVIERIKQNKLLLLEYLNSKQKKSYLFDRIPTVPHQPHYALSSSQMRLWIISHLEDANVAYNMPGLFIIQGDLNFEALMQAFNSVIERHEVLRTIFKEVADGSVRQFISKADEFIFTINRIDGKKSKRQLDEQIH